jgi:hypothetical protein
MMRLIVLCGILCALVAVSAVGAQDRADEAPYRLIGVQELDLFAGPARTAAHLAPDGTTFAHLAGNEVCLYALANDQWAQTRCFELAYGEITDPEDMRWSPDGRYLTLPTFDALIFFRDSDIRVLDTEDGKLINLTDDGFDDSLMGDYQGNLDLAPRWLDDDTLLFIRYGTNADAPAEASFSERLQPTALYTVDVPASGAPAPPAFVATIAADFSVPTYLLSVDRAQARAAYNVDIPREGEGHSIWQTGLDGAEPPALLADAPEGMAIIAFEYAADGGTVMVSLSDAAAFALTVQLVAAETGEAVTLNPALTTASDAQDKPVEPQLNGAGWSPTGLAIAYVMRDVANPEASGLYIASAPGEPGQLILAGNLYGTTCCQRVPITWAANDTIMIGRGGEPGVLLVRVG